MSNPALFKRILVPTDFGEAASSALDVAVDLAGKYGASVRLFHTYEVPTYPYPGMGVAAVDLFTPIRNAAQLQLNGALEDLRKRSPDAVATLAYGAASREILDCIEKDQIDLVVMGTHGRHGVTHVILGSVAEKVVRFSKVPVLTVRGALPPAK